LNNLENATIEITTEVSGLHWQNDVVVEGLKNVKVSIDGIVEVLGK
jgi:hypothetical protein